MKCKDCEYFKYDPEYGSQGYGYCNNDKVMGQTIIFDYCEAFFIIDNFGCIFFKSK